MSEDDISGIPPRMMFNKNSRIVATISIQHKLLQDAHCTDHVGVTKTYNAVRALFWWLALFSIVKRMVSSCQICQLSRNINPNKLVHHPLETVHAPSELAYLDILGPVTGIRSEYRYILTAIDGFSRLLATRPIKNRCAQTVVSAIREIFS